MLPLRWTDCHRYDEVGRTPRLGSSTCLVLFDVCRLTDLPLVHSVVFSVDHLGAVLVYGMHLREMAWSVTADLFCFIMWKTKQNLFYINISPRGHLKSKSKKSTPAGEIRAAQCGSAIVWSLLADYFADITATWGDTIVGGTLRSNHDRVETCHFLSLCGNYTAPHVASK